MIKHASIGPTISKLTLIFLLSPDLKLIKGIGLQVSHELSYSLSTIQNQVLTKHIAASTLLNLLYKQTYSVVQFHV